MRSTHTYRFHDEQTPPKNPYNIEATNPKDIACEISKIEKTLGYSLYIKIENFNIINKAILIFEKTLNEIQADDAKNKETNDLLERINSIKKDYITPIAVEISKYNLKKSKNLSQNNQIVSYKEKKGDIELQEFKSKNDLSLPCKFTALPNELLIIIFEFFDVKDYFRLATVSKFFRDFIYKSSAPTSGFFIPSFNSDVVVSIEKIHDENTKTGEDFLVKLNSKVV